jgi:predicted nucleic acid-binding protein
VDASGWIAALHPRDRHHHAANEMLRAFRAARVPLATTDLALSELLDYFCALGEYSRYGAASAVRRVLADRNVLVIPCGREQFLAGLAFYGARPDKEYSLPHCIAMRLMHENAWSEALTNDGHFAQEGFRVLLP